MTAIIFVSIFFGILIGASGDTKTIEKEVTVDKIVEVPVEVEKNISEWRELKEIDDKAFQVAISNSELCAAGFYAISQGDADTVQAVADETKKNIQEFDELGGKRKEVLTKLGY